MIVITLANQKGGVGKTTSAINIAHGLAMKNYTVLVLDADPQGQCAPYLGLSQEPGLFNFLVAKPPMRDVVRTTGRENLWLLPGDKRTLTAQGLMLIERQGVHTLRQALEERVNGKRLHFVVIDTSPGAGGLQEHALWAADLLLIPCAVDFLALKGVREILKTLNSLERQDPPAVRILPTFYDEVTTESKVNLDKLRAAFEGITLQPIHRAVVFRSCPAWGQTIFEHQPDSRAAREYSDVVQEVISVSKGL